MERFFPLIKKLIQKLRLERWFRKDKKTLEAIALLHRRQDKKKIWLELWCRRLLMLTAGLGITVLFAVATLCEENPADVIVDGHYLQNGENETATFGVEAATEDGLAQEEITVDWSEEEERTEEPQETSPDAKEVMLAAIREAIEEAVAGREEAASAVSLPQEVSGTKVTYRNLEHRRDFSACFLCLLAVGVLPVLWRQQCQTQLKERDRQLMLDYPEVINKIMLLLSAGLTVRGCLERMCEEYRIRLEEGGTMRYVYEEISVCYQEIQNGVSEARAIEEFGKRCRLLPYLRFSSLITQNIRKGSEGLTALLETEAIEAFEKRKEQVKIMGETAGTKLLLPMILMLGVVMAIIVIPAFMTM